MFANPFYLVKGSSRHVSDELNDNQSVHYVRRSRRSRPERSGFVAPEWSWQRTAFVAVGVVLLVALIAAAEAAASMGRVHPGVAVAGVEIGGLTPVKAEKKLEAELPKLAAPVTVTYETRKWVVDPNEVGLTFDNAAIVDEAMKIGRSGGAFASLGQRLGCWFGGRDIAPLAETDSVAMATALDSIAEGTDVEPVDAGIEMDGTTPKVTPSAAGRGLRRNEASSAVLAAFLTDAHQVAAPVGEVAVRITDEDAEAATKIVDQMVSADAKVTLGEKEWVFAPAEIANWLAFRAVEASAGADDWVLQPYVSQVETSKTVLPALGAKVGRPARDAKFKTRSGHVTIVPSQDGIGPDIETLASSLTSELADAASDRVVELQTRTVRPALTTAEAEQMGVSERISTYTTTYEASNKPRVNNIHLLGDSLDGKLIPPGGTFSFNKAVGERTAAKGYKEANAIVNGKLVPQLGGGICQVGTTLFNAIYESGLPVLERKNHSFYISHYPKGRDATVSWGGPDLKFKNDTDSWILVSVAYTNSSITISLYGTDPGYTVSTEAGPWRNERPFPIEEVKDATLAQGVRVIEDNGITGRTMTVKRTVTKDGTVIRTDEFVSVYKPKVQVVRVGTKPKASKPTSKTP